MKEKERTNIYTTPVPPLSQPSLCPALPQGTEGVSPLPFGSIREYRASWPLEDQQLWEPSHTWLSCQRHWPWRQQWGPLHEGLWQENNDMTHPQLIGENTHSQVQCRCPMETPNITVCVLGGGSLHGAGPWMARRATAVKAPPLCP